MSNLYEHALRDAIDRDLSERERLEHMATVVATALDALAHDCAPLQHPDAEWSPDELMEALTEAAAAIEIELGRVSAGPVVMGDW